MRVSRTRTSFHLKARALVIAGVAAVMPALAGSPAWTRSRAEDLTVTGTFGFDGYFKDSTPSPLVVNVTNSGGMFEGWVLGNLESWLPPTYYTRPLVLPPGGRQRLELACFGCYEGNLCEVPVELYTSDGHMVKRMPLPSYRLGRYDSLMVHLGAPSAPLGNLRVGNNPGCLIMSDLGFLLPARMIDYPPRVFPVVLEPDELPENALVMEGVSLVAASLREFLELEQEKRDLLSEYVRYGGNLLVYYRDGVDPVEGWQGEPLLPVEPAGRTYSVPLGAFLEACEEILPRETLEMILPRTIGLEREIHGEVIQVAEGEIEAGGESPGTPLAKTPSPWSAPESFTALAVDPREDCDTVKASNSRHPFLAVGIVGGGRVGFAAFDPFVGEPGAGDPPIALLATFGLLDPISPLQRLVPMALEGLRGQPDPRIQGYFSQGTSTGGGWLIRWLSALGPPLVFLAGLPVLALIAWGRGKLALVMFAGWAVVMTGFSSFGERYWISDRAVANEANVYWCEAVPPDEADAGWASQARLYSQVIYGANDPIARTLTFEHAGGLVDEYVEMETWPYGAITIEEGAVTRIPNVVIEVISLRSVNAGLRSFVYRRQAPELRASGQLVLAPDRAHLTLDATLPSPAISGWLVLESPDPRIDKPLGSLPKDLHLDFDLEEGTEIVRGGALLPEIPGSPTREGRWKPVEPPEEGLSYPLRALANMVMDSAMGRAQAYTRSRVTGRRTQAYVILASQETATGVSIDPGELDRRALTVVVIAVPMAYER